MRAERANETARVEETALNAERILVVEDEQSVRTIVKRILTTEGYEVVEASNGSEALRELEASDGFDLVVTDVVMPVMSGIELGQRIVEQFPGVKLVYMSGYSEFFTTITLSPRTVLIDKPFSRDQLVTTLREVLDETGADQASMVDTEARSA